MYHLLHFGNREWFFFQSNEKIAFKKITSSFDDADFSRELLLYWQERKVLGGMNADVEVKKYNKKSFINIKQFRLFVYQLNCNFKDEDCNYK